MTRLMKTISEVRQMNQIPTLVGEVVATRPITPRLRRVTIGGADLRRFQPKGPDQFMYFLLPPPGTDRLTVGSDFTWTAQRRMPDDQKPVGAYYTVRAHRPEGAELDFDMVLHESHGDEGGHASRWAATAAPGAPVALWGPRVAFSPPADTDEILIFADETGVPAVAAIAEWLDPVVSLRALIEVSGPEDESPMPTDPNIDVRWLHRGAAEPGTTDLLEAEASSMERPAADALYVYGGGESRSMTAIRKIVRREWKLPREAVEMVPYWRRSDR